LSNAEQRFLCNGQSTEAVFSVSTRPLGGSLQVDTLTCRTYPAPRRNPDRGVHLEVSDLSDRREY